MIRLGPTLSHFFSLCGLSPGYATPGVYQEVSLRSEIAFCRLQSLLDQFLQLADAGRLLLGGGGAEGETGAAVGAGGRSGQPLPEELQHAALLAALQALQSPTITQRHHQIQTINRSTVGSVGRTDLHVQDLLESLRVAVRQEPDEGVDKHHRRVVWGHHHLQAGTTSESNSVPLIVFS